MKDERLEALSVMVGRGIPVGFSEALEVIEYQEALKAVPKVRLWGKLRKLFKNFA